MDEQNFLPPCIACGKASKRVWEDIDQPDGAVMFRGNGTYGSAYDYAPEMLIIICDECLENAIKEGALAKVTRPKNPEYTTTKWEAAEEQPGLQTQ